MLVEQNQCSFHCSGDLECYSLRNSRRSGKLCKSEGKLLLLWPLLERLTKLGLAVLCIAWLRLRDAAEASQMPQYPQVCPVQLSVFTNTVTQNTALVLALEHSHLFCFYINGFWKKYFNLGQNRQNTSWQTPQPCVLS